MSKQPLSSAETALSKAEKLERLRRKMASIPARSDGTEPATPSVMLKPVGEREPTPIVATTQSTLRMLPVPAPIADLLPRGGLARGTVVSVDGAASVLLGLLATVTAAVGHVAVIGMPGLGLLAFHEQGGDLKKVALVPQPKEAAVECAAILLDGFDVIVLGLSGAAVTPSRGRAVAARSTKQGIHSYCHRREMGRSGSTDLIPRRRIHWIIPRAWASNWNSTRRRGRRQRIPTTDRTHGDPRRRWRTQLGRPRQRTRRRDVAAKGRAVINTDHWTERWPDHPVIRTLDPPKAVKVDIGRALPLGRGGASRADHVSMRVKTSALYMSGYLDGILKFWARMQDGQWLAGVTVHVTDAGGTNSVNIDMLVTADAITEAPAT